MALWRIICWSPPLRKVTSILPPNPLEKLRHNTPVACPYVPSSVHTFMFCEHHSLILMAGF